MTSTAAGSGTVGALFRAARPRQWVKNVLVVAAPVSAGVIDRAGPSSRVAVAFVAFCLAASGTYLLNDVFDVEADRLHPVKRLRPIAAGDLAVSTACVAGVSAIGAAIAVAFVTGWRLPVVIAVYAALTTAYTMWFKNVAVVDLAIVAAGFVLRMIAGAVAVNVPISVWFFIVASFGSLFMIAGKRHAEHREMGPGRGSHRATLDEYSIEFLGYVRAVASGVAMVGYCLWAFDKSAHRAGVPWYELSIVPFVIAMLRYALVVENGGGGAPEEVVLTDRSLQVMGAVWVVLVAVAIYAH